MVVERKYLIVVILATKIIKFNVKIIHFMKKSLMIIIFNSQLVGKSKFELDNGTSEFIEVY
jgi:hypothetical protein